MCVFITVSYLDLHYDLCLLLPQTLGQLLTEQVRRPQLGKTALLALQTKPPVVQQHHGVTPNRHMEGKVADVQSVSTVPLPSPTTWPPPQFISANRFVIGLGAAKAPGGVGSQLQASPSSSSSLSLLPPPKVLPEWEAKTKTASYNAYAAPSLTSAGGTFSVAQKVAASSMAAAQPGMVEGLVFQSSKTRIELVENMEEKASKLGKPLQSNDLARLKSLKAEIQRLSRGSTVARSHDEHAAKLRDKGG